MQSTAFYEVAAQVIPVLVLVQVVEFRLFGGTEKAGGWWASARELRPGERIPTFVALFVVVYCGIFFFAEIAALHVIRTQEASDWREGLVQLALVLGLMNVFFIPTQPYVETLLDRTPLYRAKVWLWRKTGSLGPDEPDPPKAGERRPASHPQSSPPPSDVRSD